MECSFEETVTNQDGSFTISKCVNRAEIPLVGDLCYGLCYVCAYNKLQAESKRLKVELKASDNWLHRLLKSCVIMLDDGEVTKRAVEKQSHYNRKALQSKPKWQGRS